MMVQCIEDSGVMTNSMGKAPFLFLISTIHIMVRTPNCICIYLIMVNV